AMGRTVALVAGQQLVATRDKTPKLMRVDLPVATAWETGRLVLSDEPLWEAVARVCIIAFTKSPFIVRQLVDHFEGRRPEQVRKIRCIVVVHAIARHIARADAVDRPVSSRRRVAVAGAG